MLKFFKRTSVPQRAPERTDVHRRAPHRPIPVPPYQDRQIPIRPPATLAPDRTIVDAWKAESKALAWIAEKAPFRIGGPEKWVYLPQREIGKKFGVHHTTVGRWFKRWEDQCLIARKKKGNRWFVRATAMTLEGAWEMVTEGYGI